MSSQIAFQSGKCFKLYYRDPRKEAEKKWRKKEEQFALVVPQTIGCEELDHIACSDSHTCEFELCATTDPLLVYHSS